MVRRSPGIVALEPVIQGLQGIQRGTDRTAAELAIMRLKDEITEMEEDIRRLAKEVLRRDFNGTKKSLRQIGHLSFSEFMKLRSDNIDHVEHCAEILVELTTAEMEELIKKYGKSSFFQMDSNKDVRSIMENMRALKARTVVMHVEIKKYKDLLRR
jgi:hypothetical protein